MHFAVSAVGTLAAGDAPSLSFGMLLLFPFITLFDYWLVYYQGFEKVSSVKIPFAESRRIGAGECAPHFLRVEKTGRARISALRASLRSVALRNFSLRLVTKETLENPFDWVFQTFPNRPIQGGCGPPILETPPGAGRGLRSCPFVPRPTPRPVGAISPGCSPE